MAKRVFKKVFKIMFLMVIFGIFYSLGFTIYENIHVDIKINNFKKKAGDTPASIINVDDDYIIKFWSVPRETISEKNDKKNIFEDSKKTILGKKGDIFVTRQSPFPEIPIFHQFMSYYYGGHAAIKAESSDLKESFLEATGFPNYDESLIEIMLSDGKKGHGFSPTASESYGNIWFDNSKSKAKDYYERFYRSRYLGLRVKNYFENNDAEKYEALLDEAIFLGREKIENEALYNFLFFLNMRRKYYCTDFVSRVYEEAYERVKNNNKNYESKGYAKMLNDDGFITSVNDLILSKDVYIAFYVEINKEDEKIVQNIYYLEDVE